MAVISGFSAAVAGYYQYASCNPHEIVIMHLHPVCCVYANNTLHSITSTDGRIVLGTKVHTCIHTGQPISINSLQWFCA